MIIMFICISNVFLSNIEKIKNSVVLIEVYDDNNELLGRGSGFCTFEENYIATNFHVIEGARYIKVITDDKKTINVKDILIFNKKQDLALLEINGSLKPLKLGNGNNIKVKQKVTAIGSPLGELNTISEGIISNTDEKDLIRISVPISHGSSGGILINQKNRVIGITSAGYDNAQNLNFAINVNVLKKMYSNYQQKNIS